MEVVLYIAAGVFLGAIAALRIFAPKTKTTVDDKMLATAEKAEPFVKGVLK